MLCFAVSLPSSQVNAAMTAAHRRLYEAAAAGDLAAFEAQKREVIRQFIITYIQASVKGVGRA